MPSALASFDLAIAQPSLLNSTTTGLLFKLGRNTARQRADYGWDQRECDGLLTTMTQVFPTTFAQQAAGFMRFSANV